MSSALLPGRPRNLLIGSGLIRGWNRRAGGLHLQAWLAFVHGLDARGFEGMPDETISRRLVYVCRTPTCGLFRR
jgi:hypothetical protein